MVAFGRSAAGQWFVRHVSARVDPWLYRVTGGRSTTTLGTITTAPLTTTGARSGLPRCELGGERFTAREVTDPDECARLFALAERVYPGWRDYRAATAAVGRRIPILRLVSRGDP